MNIKSTQINLPYIYIVTARTDLLTLMAEDLDAVNKHEEMKIRLKQEISGKTFRSLNELEQSVEQHTLETTEIKVIEISERYRDGLHPVDNDFMCFAVVDENSNLLNLQAFDLDKAKNQIQTNFGDLVIAFENKEELRIDVRKKTLEKMGCIITHQSSLLSALDSICSSPLSMMNREFDFIRIKQSELATIRGDVKGRHSTWIKKTESFNGYNIDLSFSGICHLNEAVVEFLDRGFNLRTQEGRVLFNDNCYPGVVRFQKAPDTPFKKSTLSFLSSASESLVSFHSA
ncbi:hypothetical protein [Vibrio sp. 10N.239.312.D08]|uniref:hypothetical protein n=1 Tax=Vibrio sp. 10N.239.312.D08 TaxID=3229978 RepID=UPI00354EE1CF